MEYFIAKWLHILSSTVLFGTGIGTAFYLLVAMLGRDLRFIVPMTRWVVRADWLFTGTTAVLQPLTGWWLVHLMGLPWSTPWLARSLGLYVLAMACWLPVVWIQMRMRDEAVRAQAGHLDAWPALWRFFIAWVVLGVPALVAFLAIFWFMVSKPAGDIVLQRQGPMQAMLDGDAQGARQCTGDHLEHVRTTIQRLDADRARRERQP